MFEARGRMSPETAHALGRFLVSVARLLARMGYGWATVTVLGATGVGWALWTWRDAIGDWFER